MSRNYKFHSPEGLYFVSFAVVEWLDVFTRNAYKNILLQNLSFCQKKKGMEIIAWCIMTNQVNLVFRSIKRQHPSLLLGDFKRFTSKAEVKVIQENADGTKIKKTTMDSQSVSTNTEYMDGFQYTDGILDFFPHAEGYVKATPAGLGGNSTYTFNYVFNYTDHLGNIRLRFTEHPQTGETKILEENHYYPYGLTHKGYNGQHSVVGIGNMSSYITIVPVTPLLADSYKYKFGGKEIQTEFDINTYDFGARNYDPALGRWMNLDPLAEAMRRHSPYNYAFNNPNYFIDPDGMAPIPGGAFVSDTKYLGTSDTSTGGFGGFDVRTFDKDGNTLDSVTVNSNQGVDINADGDITKNDLQTPGDGELSLETAENNSGLNSNDPPSRWQKIFKSFRQTADISTCLSGLSGTAQVGMLEYRKSLPIENKIGTFSRFSSTYIGLGKVTRIGGNIGNVATLGGIYYDYTEMTSGNISQTRFAFRTTSVFASLGTSIAVGSAYGGPYGAAGGALVGAAFVGAEIFYDWWNSNITPQINRSFQFNINGLMHGFRP